MHAALKQNLEEYNTQVNTGDSLLSGPNMTVTYLDEWNMHPDNWNNRYSYMYNIFNFRIDVVMWSMLNIIMCKGHTLWIHSLDDYSKIMRQTCSCPQDTCSVNDTMFEHVLRVNTQDLPPTHYMVTQKHFMNTTLLRDNNREYQLHHMLGTCTSR